MSYIRVIPRDFFNEAKLLKCMGKLSLDILDRMLPEGLDISIDENGEPFAVAMMEDGSLTVENYLTCVNGVPAVFATTYNARDTYPFFCIYDWVAYRVYDETGKFSEEFKEFAETLKQIR
jgi:hypothetical protein